MRPLLFAIMMIAFIAAPLLACCGAQAADMPPPAPAAHDCAHGPAMNAADTALHLDCDGCGDCNPGEQTILSSSKKVETCAADAPVAPRIEMPEPSILAVGRFARPPATAPPEASPVRLHTKITV